MFCSKCGNQINQGERFCGVCGNSVHTTSVQYHPPVSKKKNKNKKWIAITISIILIICLIAGALFVPLIGFINKIKTKETQEILNILSDGYWMTMDYHNTIDMLDYDYYNDFGLIFYPEMHYDGMHDSYTGLAVTTDGQVLEYVINPFNETYCCTLYYSTESSSCSSFLIDYDEVNDVLAVTIVTEFLDIYNFFDTNIEEDLVIYLSHFRGNDKNTELEKKLYFEYWSDVDGDYYGTENKIMTNLFADNPDATIYRLFKNNNRQFHNCDVSLFEYTLGNNKYTYYPTNYDFDKDKNLVGLSFNDSTFEYFRYDEEENCLINDSNGQKVYCVSNNTEYSATEIQSYILN